MAIRHISSLLKISEKGPALLDREIGKTLEITACAMFLADREQHRAFEGAACSGFMTTEWRSYYVGPQSHGFLFTASIVEIRTAYEVNMLMAGTHLEAAKHYMEWLHDGEPPDWRPGVAAVSSELYDALYTFNNGRPN